MCPMSQVVLVVGFIVLGSCSEAAFFAALSFGQLFKVFLIVHLIDVMSVCSRFTGAVFVLAGA